MKTFNSVLIVTHIIYRKLLPYDPLEGPYRSVVKSLIQKFDQVASLQIPIDNFKMPILYGAWGKEKKIKIPSLLGSLTSIKYFLDVVLTLIFAVLYNLKSLSKKKLVIAIDPLTCFPLIFLKKLLNFKLVYYCVDFNKTRFKNNLMQFFYEKADELSSRYSNQTWVVSESLQKFKKKYFKVNSFYIPNSTMFTNKYYKKGKNLRKGNKLVWGGSFLTKRQYDIFFGILKKIQKIRPDIEILLAPTDNYDKYKKYITLYKIKNIQVVKLFNRIEWQKFVATCDVGIAIYDDQFGSTKFIEPLKVWDFIMCRVPFIISLEPSLSNSIKKSSVAYQLSDGNNISDNKSLEQFLLPENLQKLKRNCLWLARKYDIQLQIMQALKFL